MKVCLINPPIEDFYCTGIRRQPLGLLYIASALQNAGHEVSLINCHSPKNREIPIPQKFQYLTEFIETKDPLYKYPFPYYKRFGMSKDHTAKTIKNTHADLYLVSSLFTTYYEETAEIISYVKDHHPDKSIAVGGYHASLHPDYFLKDLEVEYVLSGEGEVNSVKLAEFLEGKTREDEIPGLIKLLNENTVRYQKQFSEIDDFAIPNRSLLLKRDFKFYKNKYTSITTSRGCPNSCSFCSSKFLWGSSYRRRSIDSIISEIDDCIKNFGINIFNFEDDNLFPNNRQAEQLLNEIIKYREKNNYNIEFTAMNGISIEKIDPHIIRLMKKAGFNEINLSLVTKSTSIQKDSNRPFNTAHFDSMVKAALENEIKPRAYFILGLPEQSYDEIHRTIFYLRSLNIDFFPSVYYNVLAPQDQWKMQRSSAFFNETRNLKRADLIKLFNLCK